MCVIYSLAFNNFYAELLLMKGGQDALKSMPAWLAQIFSMQMRRTIFIILCVYLSQLFFVSVIHFWGERSERDCADCYTGEYLNSSCNDKDGPCKNPVHHHHKDHRHDPAHCSFCKTFFKDIEYIHICSPTICEHFSIASNITHMYSATLLSRLFLIRAPPYQNFLT
mgnify:FL=1